MKKFKWLVLAIIAFAAGVIITFQWQGSKYGMSLYDFFKRPDIKEVPVAVIKRTPLIVSDDVNIKIINQEYRDALLKISVIEYDGSNNDDKMESMNNYALKALLVPEEIYKKNPK